MNKRIYILFKNESYEIEVNSYHSIHRVIDDLYNHIIKKELYKKYTFYKSIYYDYLIKNKDYFLKVINNDESKENIYLEPNYSIGLYNHYELVIKFDIIILLNMITEYIIFFVKNIILVNIIIKYVLLNICNNYYHLNVNNIVFDYFNNFTFKSLFVIILIFTIMWIILLYIIFIKNKSI